jgi:hypothetical protein
LEERERRLLRRKLLSFYPDEGPLSRKRYVPHMAFFAAGKVCRERALMAANRIEKV